MRINHIEYTTKRCDYANLSSILNEYVLYGYELAGITCDDKTYTVVFKRNKDN